MFGVHVSAATICRTLRFMGCTRQAIRQIALQQSEVLRAQFMAMVSMYDPRMLIWLDESGCDRRHSMRKYAYSIRGMPMCDHRGGIQPFQSCCLMESMMCISQKIQ